MDKPALTIDLSTVPDPAPIPIKKESAVEMALRKMRGAISAVGTTAADLMLSFIPDQPPPFRWNMTGPGRKTLHTRWKGVDPKASEAYYDSPVPNTRQRLRHALRQSAKINRQNKRIADRRARIFAKKSAKKAARTANGEKVDLQGAA